MTGEAAMTEPVTNRPHATGGHALVHRLRFLAAMMIAAAVFWHFGWWVARPADPQAAVSLLMIDNGVITIVELLALSIVVSGLAVAICGGDTAERGPLAVAVGLAALAARGGRMDTLLLDRLMLPADNGAVDVYPLMGMIAETWLWLALIAAGIVVGRWVAGWFVSGDAIPAGMAVDETNAWDIRHALGALIIGFLIAWSVVSFAAGAPATPIKFGQLAFALVLAFLLATLIGQWFCDMRNRMWMLAVVGLVATLAYWFGQPSNLEAARKLGAFVPIDDALIRPLPIEYAALGAIGVLLERDFMSAFFVVIGYTPRHKSVEPAP